MGLSLDDAFPFDGSAKATIIGRAAAGVKYVPDQPWLEVSIRTTSGSWVARLATEDPHGDELLTAIRTTPRRDVLCAIASGTAYAVAAHDSAGASWTRLEPHSVRYTFGDTARSQLVLVGDMHVAAYAAPKESGLLDLSWVTGRIRHGDLRLSEVCGQWLRLAAWDAAERDHHEYRVDLATGSVDRR